MTGINVLVFTNIDEISAAKKDATILLGTLAKSKDNPIQISVTVDACEFVGENVRVNLTVVKQSVDEIGQAVGAAMGKALEGAFAKMDAMFGE